MAVAKEASEGGGGGGGGEEKKKKKKKDKDGSAKADATGGGGGGGGGAASGSVTGFGLSDFDVGARVSSAAARVSSSSTSGFSQGLSSEHATMAKWLEDRVADVSKDAATGTTLLQGSKLPPVCHGRITKFGSV